MCMQVNVTDRCGLAMLHASLAHVSHDGAPRVFIVELCRGVCPCSLGRLVALQPEGCRVLPLVEVPGAAGAQIERE